MVAERLCNAAVSCMRFPHPLPQRHHRSPLRCRPRLGPSLGHSLLCSRGCPVRGRGLHARFPSFGSRLLRAVAAHRAAARRSQRRAKRRRGGGGEPEVRFAVLPPSCRVQRHELYQIADSTKSETVWGGAGTKGNNRAPLVKGVSRACLSLGGGNGGESRTPRHFKGMTMKGRR